MHAILLGLCGLVFGTACASRPAPFGKDHNELRSDRPAPFNPAKTYPEWAYDAPSYTKPIDQPKAEPKSRAKDPEHYFTSKPVIMVHQPAGYVPEEIPRVAIWYTRDNGSHWKKAGYFGRSATYFPLEVKQEGDYGIRFVGPGQESAMETPPNPVCVHHVDMTPPKVALSIDPEQAWYTLGQRITVNWTATDPHLEAMPARVSVITDWASDNGRPIEIAREQADAGSIEYTIPSSLMGDGFRFRVDAIDRAGNIGMAYSQTVQIEPDRMEGTKTPPVRVISHDETASSTSQPPVNSNITQTSPEATPTQAVSTPVAPASSGGEMLPLEEIPASRSAIPVREAEPAPPIETPSKSPAPNMDERAQAVPVAPTGGSTASTPSNTSTPEPLPLMPLSETPIENSSVSKAAPPNQTTPATNDRMIVSDTTAEADSHFESSHNDSESIDDASMIRPISVTPEPTADQPQASQDQKVECDSIDPVREENDADDAGETAPVTEESDDHANAESVTDWQATVAPQAVDSTPQISGSTFADNFVNGLRAAEAAVERLLEGVKESNGVTAAELVRGADVMVGGGLAAPMPATVLSMIKEPIVEPPHAWRALTTRATRRGDVWTLPRPALNFELPRMFARETSRVFRSSSLSAENSAARGSRIQAVAVSSDPD